MPHDAPMGIWDHWIIFNMHFSIQKINEGETPQSMGGRNSWGRTGYGGPCPPSGEHRYFFKAYALDTELNLEEFLESKDKLITFDLNLDFSFLIENLNLVKGNSIRILFE